MRIPHVLSAIIFSTLIALLIFIPIPYGSVEPWSEAVFECVAFALAFLWCVHAMLSGSWFTEDLRVFLPVIGLMVLAILQSLSFSHESVAGVSVMNSISADPFESWVFALRLSALVLVGLLATNFIRGSLRLTIFVNAILVSATIAAVFGVVRLTMQHHDGFLLSSLPSGGGFAQFINKNHFAFFIEPAMGLLVMMTLLDRRAGHRRLLYLSGMILLWATLIMSRSRGGLIAVSVQMIIAAVFFIYTHHWFANRNGRGRRIRTVTVVLVAIIATAVVVVLATVWLGGDQLSTGFETATVEMTSKSDDNHVGARRRDIWRATLQMWRAHPIVGAGLGGYWAEIPAYHDASGMLSPQQAHDDYLELSASAGIVGVGLFVWFVVALLQTARKALDSFTGIQRVFAIGAIVGILGVCVHSLIDFGLHITANALVFVMLLALLSLKPINQRPRAQEHRNAAFS